MKSAVETLSPTRAKLTVEVPFEELKPSLDAAYQKIAKQINVPGFRRGKVPPAVIDRQVGRGPVLDEAINAVVPQQYMAALQEHDLEPLPLVERPVLSAADRRAANLEWARTHAGPWVKRRLSGTSSGDGLSPRWPTLAPVATA